MKLIDRIDGFAKKFERFVAGSAVNDPLYLTNRTVGQKLRVAILIGVPVIALGTFIFMAMDSQFDRPASIERAADLEAKSKQVVGEAAAKVLPNLDKSYLSEQSKDIDVMEAAVNRSPEPTLVGRLRNNTDNLIRVADVVFDITDQEGSQVGGISVRVENIAAKGTSAFRVVLPQKTARSALVRELHSR
jgi:hypothetical protein